MLSFLHLENITVPDAAPQQWLREQAEIVVRQCIQVKDPSYPEDSDDEQYSFHRAFMHMGVLYVNLRTAIKYEDGPIY